MVVQISSGLSPRRNYGENDRGSKKGEGWTGRVIFGDENREVLNDKETDVRLEGK